MVLNTFRYNDDDDNDDEMTTNSKICRFENKTIFPQTLILNIERLRFRMKYSRIFDIWNIITPVIFFLFFATSPSNKCSVYNS